MKKPTNPQHLVGCLETLADPTRIRLLKLLDRHELGVTELCEILQLPQSTVSRHLKLLADQGWLHSRRQATSNLYRLASDNLDEPTRALWETVREESTRWATTRQDQLRLTRRLEDRQRRTRAFFAGAAAQWDDLRRQLYGELFIHQALLALLPADWVVADLGCGTGIVAAELAQVVRQVHAIDHSEAMLGAARRRIQNLPNVTLHEADLEALPLENCSTDAALMLLVLSYLPDPPAVLAEAARILKPGGRLVLIDLLAHDREDFRREMGQHVAGFEQGDISALLIGAGFCSPAVRALPPEPSAKGPALFLATAVRGPATSRQEKPR